MSLELYVITSLAIGLITTVILTISAEEPEEYFDALIGMAVVAPLWPLWLVICIVLFPFFLTAYLVERFK